MFNFISNIVFSLILPGLSVGCLLIIVSFFIPTTHVMYRAPIQILGVIILVFFLFQAGRFSEFQKHEKDRLTNIALVAELKAKSEKINTETIVRYVDRIKVVEKIKEVKTNVYITKEADAACVIGTNTSRELTRMLNSSARGRIPDAPRKIDDSTNR